MSMIDFSQPMWHLEEENAATVERLFHTRYPGEEFNKLQIAEQRRQLISECVRFMRSNSLWIGEQIQNDNASRTSVDGVVIHHTKGDHVMYAQNSLEDNLLYINALQLIRLVAYYRGNPKRKFPEEYGKDLNLGREFTEPHPLAGKPNFIQYHYMIDMNGQVVQNCGHSEVLWHAAGVNSHTIAICAIGDYDSYKVSIEVQNSMARLLTLLKGEIPRLTVSFHRDVGKNPTTCPGDHMVETIKQIILEL